MRFKRLTAVLFAVVLSLQLVASPSAEARRKKQSLLQAIETELENKLDMAMVTPPKDEEICFSPDEPCDTKLVKFIESAQSSIDVAIFDINLDQVVHHLLVKSRKIPVRILADRRQAKGQYSGVPTLLKGGANVRYGRQRGVMHNKFIIVDGKMIEIGSFNFTNHASRANEENQLYLSKPAIVEQYKKRFEKIWSKGKPAKD